MGILRADRIAGLGGANAITGSVFFGNDASSGTAHDHIVTEPSSDFTMGTGDFTLEGWFFVSSVAPSWQSLIGDTLYGDTGGFTFYVNTNQLNFWKGGASIVSGGTVKANTWHHLAYSRASGSNRIFVDGVLAATNNDSTDYTDNELSIGANNVDKGGVIGAYGLNGFASNVRVTKGTALYTATFTPPTVLEKRSDTVLLCCQSCGNVQQEATGKKIIGKGNAAASHFTPNSPVGFSTTTDVGSQYGTTFNGFGNFATSTYMVPPGGNTRERNRGRGLVMGGGRTTPGSAGINNITFIEIQSGGNAQDFGDLTDADVIIGGSLASSTRGIRAGGFDPSPASNLNTIDFVTIANTANATDFGDLVTAAHWIQSGGSQTRGVMAGGNGGGNVIQYVTIATAGNSQDFGDLINSYTHTVGSGNAASSPTRMLIAGGTDPSNNAQNIIQYVTIASTGNAVDCGDLTDNKTRFGVCSSATRGLYGGGGPGETDKTNTITFVTLASTGNTTDFGDRIVASNNVAATSNATRGVFIGGGDPSATINTIDFITIATTGNATDFGDNVTLIEHTSACSDSHGGIS